MREFNMNRYAFTDCVDLVGNACKEFSGEKDYVSTGAVSGDHINQSAVEIVDYIGRPSRANLVVEGGDILFAKMQGTKKTLFITEELSENIYSTGFCAVRPHSNVLTSKCLFYLLNSKTFLDQKDKNCSGATQKAITNSGLKKILITLPPIDRQSLIANQLDLISNIIKTKNSELQQLDDLVKARFVEMFGEPQKNPFKFRMARLKDTCEVITGNTPPRSVKKYYGDFIEWIKTDNIVSGLINPTTASECLSEAGMHAGRTVDENVILMACIAGSVASIGRVCVTNRKVAFNQQINAIVPRDYNVLFLYVMLTIAKPYLVENLNMALKGILSKSKLEEKSFIVPPLDLQNEFASFAQQVEKSKAAVQKSLDETQLLFESLLQKYFE